MNHKTITIALVLLLSCTTIYADGAPRGKSGKCFSAFMASIDWKRNGLFAMSLALGLYTAMHINGKLEGSTAKANQNQEIDRYFDEIDEKPAPYIVPNTDTEPPR